MAKVTVEVSNALSGSGKAARLANVTGKGLTGGLAYQVKTSKGYMLLVTAYSDTEFTDIPTVDGDDLTLANGTVLTKGYKFNTTGMVRGTFAEVEAPSKVTTKRARKAAPKIAEVEQADEGITAESIDKMIDAKLRKSEATILAAIKDMTN